MSRQRILLGLALIATLLAAYFAPEPDDELVVPAVRARAEGARPSTPHSSARPRETLEVLRIRPRGEEEVGSATSPMKQWIVRRKKRPVVAAPPPPPAPPEAPPLPFKALGQYVEDGVTTVFLQYKGQNLAVHAGETIVDDYKVEKVSDGVMTLLFIPLNQEQTLEIGAAL